MSAAAWITMVLVCAYVWGGLAFLVALAMRKERFKGAVPDQPWEP